MFLFFLLFHTFFWILFSFFLLFFGFSCCCWWWIEHYHLHKHHHKQPKQTNNPKTTNMPIFFSVLLYDSDWLTIKRKRICLIRKNYLFIHIWLIPTYKKRISFWFFLFFWKEKKKELERKNRIEKQNLYKKKIIRFVNMDFKSFSFVRLIKTLFFLQNKYPPLLK